MCYFGAHPSYLKNVGVHFLRAFACLQYSLKNSDDNSLVLLGQNLISTAISYLADEEYRLVSLLFEILAIDTKNGNAPTKIKKLQQRCPDISAMENTLFKTEYWQTVYEEACYNKLLDVVNTSNTWKFFTF